MVLVEEVPVAEVSDQEKKVDSEAIEIAHQDQNVQTDQEEKADSEATALPKENQVLFKEKRELQDVRQDLQTDLQVARLMTLKQEDLEKAK